MIYVILFLLFLILTSVIGWHILFALVLGGVFAISAMGLVVIIASVVVFCALVLLLFLFTIPGIFILGLIFTIWTLIAIVLFPILFPILLPLFIIFGFIAYVRRKNIRKLP